MFSELLDAAELAESLDCRSRESRWTAMRGRLVLDNFLTICRISTPSFVNVGNDRRPACRTPVQEES